MPVSRKPMLMDLTFILSTGYEPGRPEYGLPGR
jgi:hypothetical protein